LGGGRNTASGLVSSITGGFNNTASGFASSISGGFENKLVAIQPDSPVLPSAEASGTRPLDNLPRSVGGATTVPVASIPRLAARRTTRPAAIAPQSAAGSTGLHQRRTTGRLAPCLPITRASGHKGQARRPGRNITKSEGPGSRSAPHCLSNFSIFSSSRPNSLNLFSDFRVACFSILTG
jgi:hypothetical protein